MRRLLVASLVFVVAGISAVATPSQATVSTSVTGSILVSHPVGAYTNNTGEISSHVPYEPYEQQAACLAQSSGRTETTGVGETGWMIPVTPGASFTLTDYWTTSAGLINDIETFKIAFYSQSPTCTSGGTLIFRTTDTTGDFLQSGRVPDGATVGIVTHDAQPAAYVPNCVPEVECSYVPTATASGLPYPPTFTYTETLTPAAPIDFSASSTRSTQGKSLTRASSTVTLTWRAPLSSGAAPITAYNVYRGVLEGAQALLVSLPLSQITVTESGLLTYSDKTVTPGQMYFYRVSAVNSYGEGDRTYELEVAT